MQNYLVMGSNTFINITTLNIYLLTQKLTLPWPTTLSCIVSNKKKTVLYLVRQLWLNSANQNILVVFFWIFDGG